MHHESPSPLALSFEQALIPSNLLAQFKTASENHVKREVAQLGNDAFKVALAMAKFAVDKGVMQVVFEGGIPAGAKLMQSGVQGLPVLMKGGKILKIGKLASKGRVAFSVAASAWLVVVEASHLISAYDNTQRLRKVEGGVDQLVRAHESEMISRMEGIYRYSKELLHYGPDALSDHDRSDLYRQCRDLMELRARWRDDFRHRLSQVQRAEASFLDSWVFFWRKDTSTQASAKSKAQEATNAGAIVQLMHVSLILQMTLAGSTGRIQAFMDVTLKDECESWRSLAEFARQRVRDIVGSEHARHFHGFLAAIDDMVAFWSAAMKKGDETPAKVPTAKAKEKAKGSPPKAAPPDNEEKILPAPAQGWTVASFAKAHKVIPLTARRQLRELCDRKKLVKKDVKGTMVYVRLKK